MSTSEEPEPVADVSAVAQPSASSASLAGAGAAATPTQQPPRGLSVLELEMKFQHRFGDQDEEFQSRLRREKSPTPPIVTDWYRQPRRQHEWTAEGRSAGNSRYGGHHQHRDCVGAPSRNIAAGVKRSSAGGSDEDYRHHRQEKRPNRRY